MEWSLILFEKNVFSERQPIHIHQHFEPFA